MNQKILAGLILVLLISIGTASADSPAIPSLPTQYFGTALTDEGNAIPFGTTIIAKLDGVSYIYIMTENGKLGAAGTFGEKLIVDPAVPPTDKTVTFWIGSTKAEETQTFDSGTAKEITLTFLFPKVTIEKDQNIPMINGRDIFAERPSIIAENTIPEDFSLTISTVEPEKEKNLPPLPKNRKSLLIVDITPKNPPAGDYTIVYPFTLATNDFMTLGLTKENIIVLHNKGTGWEELTPTIKKEHADGTVDYEVRMTAFSAYMIAAKTTDSTEQTTTSQTKRPGSSGGSTGSSGGSGTTTAKPTVSASPTKQPTVTTTTIPQTSAPTENTASQPTLTQSPAPLVGFLLGLGAAGFLIRRRR